MPYAHLQLARAMRKPNTNGDKNGATINPIVHMFNWEYNKDSSKPKFFQEEAHFTGL